MANGKISKKMHKRSFPIVLALVLLLTSCPQAAEPSGIVGESAIVMDYDSGEILYSKNPDKPMYPASTTKIMTALLALENLQLDTNVVIDDDTPFTEGSRIYLFANEIISVEDLLYALLLESANDSAVALAKAVSGDVDAFVARMNERAVELGATHTHFTNPNGLPDPEHVTTVHDLSLIARKALENDIFRKMVKTINYTIEPTNEQPEFRYLKNGNRFLWGTGSGNQIYYNGQWIDIKYDLVEGVKTGYTLAAQQCLVTSAARGDRRVIAAVFKSQQKNIYADTRKLIDFALYDFDNITLCEKGERVITAQITGSRDETLFVMTGETLIRSLPAGFDPDAVESEIRLRKNLSAPVEQGEVLGEIVFSLDDETLGSIPLVAEKTVLKKTFSDTLQKYWEKVGWIKTISISILLYLLWRTLITIKRLKAMKRRARRKKTFR